MSEISSCEYRPYYKSGDEEQSLWFVHKDINCGHKGVSIGKVHIVMWKKLVINSKVMDLFLEEDFSHEDYLNQLRVILEIFTCEYYA